MKLTQHLNETGTSFTDKLAKAVGYSSEKKWLLTNTQENHNKFYIITIKPNKKNFDVVCYWGAIKSFSAEGYFTQPERAPSQTEPEKVPTFNNFGEAVSEALKIKNSKIKKGYKLIKEV